VHDHRTAVSVTFTNNQLGQSTGLQLVDYLPAGLEFLGCGDAGDDRSTSVTEEYPGSGPLNASSFPAPGGSVGCPVPTTVDTALVDPPGAQPLGVYTVLTWNNAALASVGAGSLPTAARSASTTSSASRSWPTR